MNITSLFNCKLLQGENIKYVYTSWFLNVLLESFGFYQ